MVLLCLLTRSSKAHIHCYFRRVKSRYIADLAVSNVVVLLCLLTRSSKAHIHCYFRRVKSRYIAKGPNTYGCGDSMLDPGFRGIVVLTDESLTLATGRRSRRAVKEGG